MLSATRGLFARGIAARLSSSGSGAVLRGFATDTHDDFKPQFKEEPAASVDDSIKQDVGSNKVFVYMKGVPTAPQCGFSNAVCRILDAYGVEYGSRNVLADPELREGVKKFSSWPTIPQVYVDGEFIGGSDILMGLHQSNDLEALLKGKSSGTAE